MTIIVVAVVAVAAAAGCGTQSAKTGTPELPAAGASVGADGSSSPTPLPSATGPFGKPVEPLTPAPASHSSPGFQPEAVTAVSDSQYWVLGTGGACSGCAPVIWHTTDAGQTFSSIPAPPTQFANYSQGTATSVSDLRFADRDDGWAFDPGLWATHDDGEQWQSIDLPGDVTELEPGAGGYVYAVVDLCAMGGNGLCPVEVMRSTAGSDAWSAVLSLDDEGAPSPSLGVHGADVWLLGVSGLWRSLDDGATFDQLPTPCSAGLGGSIDPVSASSVWAFCPTGTEGGPWVSTDGGSSFSSASGDESFDNAAMVSAPSASTALVTVSRDGLVATDDGGASYRVVPAFDGGRAWWLGFTDPSVGYALVTDQLPGGTEDQLWRTGDGGEEWTLITFP